MDRQILNSNKQKNDAIRIDPSVILSLSLFIILLAFFIVLNGISNYSENKVGSAFESLDIAFARQIIPVDYNAQIENSESESEGGSGDSLKDIQGTLRSVLPGLDTNLSESSNGGTTMAVRMKKEQFDRLSNQLIPILIRILNLKDNKKSFQLEITSYVENVFSQKSLLSFEKAANIKNEIISRGLDANRMTVKIENGNPANMMLEFHNFGGASHGG